MNPEQDGCKMTNEMTSAEEQFQDELTTCMVNVGFPEFCEMPEFCEVPEVDDGTGLSEGDIWDSCLLTPEIRQLVFADRDLHTPQA